MAKTSRPRRFQYIRDEIALARKNGDVAIVLQLLVVERYAGSLIIAARNNPRGVPPQAGRNRPKANNDRNGNNDYDRS